MKREPILKPGQADALTGFAIIWITVLVCLVIEQWMLS